MWRVYRAAGRPWPVLCPEDDVIDYMVMEAVCLRVQREDERAERLARQHAQQQAAFEDLSQFR